jgi:hypothetical protein
VRQRLPGEADRRELQRMLQALAPDDVVTVTRIDRLARSTFDLFSVVKRIVDAGGEFRSLAEPWADSSTPASYGCHREAHFPSRPASATATEIFSFEVSKSKLNSLSSPLSDGGSHPM